MARNKQVSSKRSDFTPTARVGGVGRGNPGDDPPEVSVGTEYLKLSDIVCWGEICFASALPRGLDEWQRDTLIAFQRGGTRGFKDRISRAVCNGGGKSLLFAIAGSWNIGCNPRARSVMTAGVYRQCLVMRDYLVPALAVLNKIQSGWKLLDDELTAPPDHLNWPQRFLWYTSDNPGLVEGQHAENLALLIDESKSVKDDIARNAMIRMHPKRVLAMSSTGDALGWFYDTFGRDSAGWDAKIVSAFDCRPEIRRWAEAEEARLGGREKARLNPEFCSAVLSLFSSGTTSALFSLSSLQHCRKNSPMIPHRHDGVIVAGLDASSASGDGDECVLRLRLGNKLLNKKTYVGFTSPVDLAGSILEDLIKERVQFLHYDAADLGVGGILKRMIEGQGSRIKCRAVAFGGSANDPEKYFNKRVEMYYGFKEAVDRCDVILPADADDLIAQLATIQRKPTETGIKKLVSKADMRKDGIHSPDDADATVLCWLKPPSERPNSPTHDISRWITQEARSGSAAAALEYSGSTVNGKFRFGGC